MTLAAGLDAGLAALGLDLPGDARRKLLAYLGLLAKWNRTYNLTAIRDENEMLTHHLLDSLAVLPVLEKSTLAGRRWVDVGSGAGLPGIPLAILRPDLHVTLLEPLLRRVNFLELAVAELGLGERVRVIRGRAEDHALTYDVVTCRALAPLPRLLGWCDPLRGEGGRIVALKGSSAAEEVAAAAGELRRRRLQAVVEELSLPGLDDPTWAVVVQGR